MKLTSGGSLAPVNEEITSLWEEIDHYQSQVERVCNTVELGDYSGSQRKKRGDKDPCYSLKKSVNLNMKHLLKDENGLVPSVGQASPS